MNALQPDLRQLIEPRQAERRRLGIALVAEGGEDVGVLLSIQAIRLRDDRVDGRADGPARIVAGQDGPGEGRRGSRHGVAELLAPKQLVAGSLQVNRRTLYTSNFDCCACRFGTGARSRMNLLT